MHVDCTLSKLQSYHGVKHWKGYVSNCVTLVGGLLKVVAEKRCLTGVGYQLGSARTPQSDNLDGFDHDRRTIYASSTPPLIFLLL